MTALRDILGWAAGLSLLAVIALGFLGILAALVCTALDRDQASDYPSHPPRDDSTQT